ncbi:MAG: glycosyltransferase [Gammaproteobacteria bacterium]
MSEGSIGEKLSGDTTQVISRARALWRRLRMKFARLVAPELNPEAVRARLRHVERRMHKLEARLVVLTGRKAATPPVSTFNRPVNLYLDFARDCLACPDVHGADVYVAHGVQALPAASALAQQAGSTYFCDVIEIPSFAARALPSRWHPTTLEMLDCAFETYLRRADGLLTVGKTLGEEIRPLNAHVHVIPNYRPAEILVPSAALRERCGLRADDALVVSISTVTTGVEVVLDALATLPANVHLATVGRFAQRDYQVACLAQAERLGIAHRLHCFEPVPYPELASFASSADVGLIVCDPLIPNHRVSLPNRIFDYMFSGVPVCTPEIADIAGIVRRWDMGAVVAELRASDWAQAISATLARREALRANALRAAGELVWESLEERLYEALGRPGRVCFLGFNYLLDNNRTVRMARSLAKWGVDVTIASLPTTGASVTRTTDPGPGVRAVTIAGGPKAPAPA